MDNLIINLQFHIEPLYGNVLTIGTDAPFCLLFLSAQLHFFFNFLTNLCPAREKCGLDNRPVASWNIRRSLINITSYTDMITNVNITINIKTRRVHTTSFFSKICFQIVHSVL